MATHVYANGNEIASKSADGKARAQGDVCHTPPPAAAGPFPPGVPTMYPNTCLASDITNGSRTVFIVGKEIALEKKSYFKTSYGDEPATKGLAKGVISGAVQGRCYFETWSPDVKVEGLSVTRHKDKVSHNHSNPSNTALFPYLTRSSRGRHACQKEEERIKKACDEPDPKDPKRNRMPGRRAARLQGKAVEKSTNSAENSNYWHKKNCTGLLQIPNNLGGDVAKDALASFEDELASLKEQLTDFDKLAGIIQEEVKAWAIEKGLTLAGKAAAKQVAGTFVPVAGNIIMGLWSAYDAAQFATELAARKEEIAGVIEEVMQLDKSIEKVTQLRDRITRIANGNPLKIDDNDDSYAKVLGDMQDALAQTNACLRARKCSLVPFKTKTHISDQLGSASQVETSQTPSGGCCPGQTGHHLIPKANIEHRSDGKGCQNYDHDAAPTVCVESALKDAGSHKRAHDAFDRAQQTRVNTSHNWSLWDSVVNPIKGPPVVDGAMTMAETIDAAVEAHSEAFPLSGCSKRCLEAQLRDYYNKHCRKASTRVVNKKGKQIAPDQTTR